MIAVAGRSKVYVFGCLIPGIVCSYPAEGTCAHLLCLPCVVQVAIPATGWSLVQRSSVVCVCVCVFVWSGHCNNEAAWAQCRLSFPQKTKKKNQKKKKNFHEILLDDVVRIKYQQVSHTLWYIKFCKCHTWHVINLLNPTGHVMHQQFNTQQL